MKAQPNVISADCKKSMCAKWPIDAINRRSALEDRTSIDITPHGIAKLPRFVRHSGTDDEFEEFADLGQINVTSSRASQMPRAPYIREKYVRSPSAFVRAAAGVVQPVPGLFVGPTRNCEVRRCYKALARTDGNTLVCVCGAF